MRQLQSSACVFCVLLSPPPRQCHSLARSPASSASFSRAPPRGREGLRQAPASCAWASRAPPCDQETLHHVIVFCVWASRAPPFGPASRHPVHDACGQPFRALHDLQSLALPAPSRKRPQSLHCHYDQFLQVVAPHLGPGQRRRGGHVRVRAQTRRRAHWIRCCAHRAKLPPRGRPPRAERRPGRPAAPAGSPRHPATRARHQGSAAVLGTP
mmetsp:Transcript_62661/g.176654  ORF Transcript_62661/g.176654 Transcript_62661/m.176654 type:complete len:212 (+) Transcript_62661:118-753(+)